MPTAGNANNPENISFERAQAAADSARTLLSTYPNVVSIGVGTKRIAGAKTDMWCVAISVLTKLSPDQLPAAAIIPAEIDGVPTDVTATGVPGTSEQGLKDKSDYNTYRPLRGGIKMGIRYLTSSMPGIAPNKLVDGGGTLGCVVLTNDPNDPPPRHVALTNWHVIENALPTWPVGQPHADPGSSCCGSNEIIGNVYKVPADLWNLPQAKVFPVDAAICTLNEDITWVAGIGQSGEGITSPVDPIAGVRDLRQEAPTPNLPVKKRGATTGETTGTVHKLDDATAVTINGNIFHWFDMTLGLPPHYYLSLPVIEIEADLGATFFITGATLTNPCQLTAMGHNFTPGDIVSVLEVNGMTNPIGTSNLNDMSFKVGSSDPAAETFTLLRLDGVPINSTGWLPYIDGGMVGLFKRYSNEGDSGSLVRDMDNNVIGLHFGGCREHAPTGRPAGKFGYACYIQDVINTLEITVPLTAAMPGIRTVPEGNNPFMAFTNAAMTKVTTKAMAEVQNDLLDTEHGVAIVRALLAHESEVRALINTNKRVAARWRHVSDLQLARGFAAALLEPGLPVVAATAGDAKRAINRFADALARYASAGMRADVARLRDLLLAMVDLTYADILASLGTRGRSDPLDSAVDSSLDGSVEPPNQIERAAQATMAAITALTDARSPLANSSPLGNSPLGNSGVGNSGR